METHSATAGDRRDVGGRFPRRIIVPVTLADDSLEAVAVAAALAGALGAELVLAGIAPLAPPEPYATAPDELEALARQSDRQPLVDSLVTERLQEAAGTLPAALRAQTMLTWGRVGAALVAAAREQHADLVVVPMRRESEPAHLLHDRTDRYVLHHSDVPVLVVPTGGPLHRR